MRISLRICSNVVLKLDQRSAKAFVISKLKAKGSYAAFSIERTWISCASPIDRQDMYFTLQYVPSASKMT